ncbi:MAG: AIR synthase-related protein [Acidimicrobiales bacterium]
MAEHPGAMEPGEFDLVGFSVGVAERDQLITGEHVRPGDVLIGLPSPGLRSNGYSLARKVLLERAQLPLDGPAYEGAHHTLAEELLVPSVIYAPAVLNLLRHVDVRAVCHVTGGGLAGNLVRVLPKGVDATVDPTSWEEPRIFGEIRRLGEIDQDEMRKVFNLGLGMVVVVPGDEAFRTLDLLRSAGHLATEIGRVEKGTGAVHFA